VAGFVIPNKTLPLLVNARILDPGTAAAVDLFWVVSGLPVTVMIGVLLGVRIADIFTGKVAQQITDPEQPEHSEPGAPTTGPDEMEVEAQPKRRGPRDSVDTLRYQSGAARGGAILGGLLGFLLLGAVLLLGPLVGVPRNIMRTIGRYWCAIPLIVALATSFILTSLQSRTDAQALQANCEEVLRRYNEGERDLAGVNLYKANLAEVDLHGANLEGAYLETANLVGANLVGVNLSKSNLENADLREANLSKTKLRDANLKDADLRGAKLDLAKLEGADLSWVKLYRAALSDANLREADLLRADLRRVTLSHANLRGANLLRADLRGADLSGADLSRAKLHRAHLSGADLSAAHLEEADLSRADLHEAEVTDEQPAQAKSLENATMPDGTKHE
jgi:uncharacterized protein YjbI with pentapeptide repeats